MGIVAKRRETVAAVVVEVDQGQARPGHMRRGNVEAGRSTQSGKNSYADSDSLSVSRSVPPKGDHGDRKVHLEEVERRGKDRKGQEGKSRGEERTKHTANQNTGLPALNCNNGCRGVFLVRFLVSWSRPVPSTDAFKRSIIPCKYCCKVQIDQISSPRLNTTSRALSNGVLALFLAAFGQPVAEAQLLLWPIGDLARPP